MNHRTLGLLAALALSTFARPAAAQAHRNIDEWSILGAETLSPGSDVLHGAFGWPDLTFGWTHGVKPGFDVGARFSLVYGVENTTDSHFGIAFAVPLRWAITRTGNVHLLLHLDPGLRLYTTNPALFGFQVPIGLNVEFQTRTPLKIGLGADFALSLFVTGDAAPQFFFGPLIGPWIEYHIDRNLAVGFDTRFGAIIDAYASDSRFVPGLGFVGHGSGTQSRFGFRAQMMLAYRL